MRNSSIVVFLVVVFVVVFFFIKLVVVEVRVQLEFCELLEQRFRDRQDG